MGLFKGKLTLKNPELDEQERFKICFQVFNAIKQLHGEIIYHRDIKPDNILLFTDELDAAKTTWKISDLGLVTLNKRSHDYSNEKIGPLGWLSPEAMNKYLTENTGIQFDCEIDNYSDSFQLGKVFWFICQGNVPIGQISIEDFVTDFRHKKDIYDLIEAMLQYSKRKRMNLVELAEFIDPIKKGLGL